VLVAQDLSSFALDRSTGRTEPRLDGPAVGGNRPIVDLVAAVSARVRWTRLLYSTRPPSTTLWWSHTCHRRAYFDLSSSTCRDPVEAHARRGGRPLPRPDPLDRSSEPTAAFRSSFIVGYPGETEEDHDGSGVDRGGAAGLGRLLPLQQRGGHYAADLDGQVPEELVAERIRECTELAGRHHGASARGPDRSTVEVLVDAPGEARTYREHPRSTASSASRHLPVGSFVHVVVTDADGPDLSADVAVGTGGAPSSLAATGPGPA